MTTRPLRVAINAQLRGDGHAGGIEPAVRGLVEILGRLDDDDTEYLVVTHPSAPHWLDAQLGQNQRVVVRSYPLRDGAPPWIEAAKRSLGPARAMLGRARVAVRRALAVRPSYGPAVSNGFFESLGVDVVHFPYQAMVLTALPSVYHPWDLQHLHYPEFFTPDTFARREATYPAYCNHATAVVTASRFTRDDVITRYGISAHKVYTIPLAAGVDAGGMPTPAEVARVGDVYGLGAGFAFYPAQTWPHKNHGRLLEALALLRDRQGVVVRLVCSGTLNEFWPTIERRLAELRLGDQVRFLGFVPRSDLTALYHLAGFVVIPSLFEGWGFPLIEAFHEGVAVACSSAAALGEYAGDGALLFNPTVTDSIADAVARMATDAALRETLARRGVERAKAFSWERAARAHRALYRRVAGHELSEEERWSLQASLER